MSISIELRVLKWDELIAALKVLGAQGELLVRILLAFGGKRKRGMNNE